MLYEKPILKYGIFLKQEGDNFFSSSHICQIDGREVRLKPPLAHGRNC